MALLTLIGLFSTLVYALQKPLAPSSFESASVNFNFPAPEQSLAALSSDEYTTLTHEFFVGYAVRIKQTTGWCDPEVRSWSGYLDVDGGAKHLFFYFFESRTSPTDDPLLMWINGGPGGSSAYGLFMELGPCRVNEHGNDTVPFPYAWNEHANVFFLDQPVGVGFSYVDYGEVVDTTEDAAKNVAAFIWIFTETFKEYRGREFHMSGESYGGRYLPAFAGEILDQNKRAVEKGLRQINLKSVIIGNGMVDVFSMLPSYYDMACTAASLPPILDVKQCVRMKRAIHRCNKMMDKSCISVHDELACRAAMTFCDEELMIPIFGSGMNPYDISKPCESEPGAGSCYAMATLIEQYLNMNSTRKLLGADEKVKHFQISSMEVNTRFTETQDMYVTTSPYYITALLERNVSVLIYVGTYDWICNWVGQERWLEALEWRTQETFNSLPKREWVVDGQIAGKTKTFGGLTYATVDGAGHMVPYDKPVEALQMINRWLGKKEL